MQTAQKVRTTLSDPPTAEFMLKELIGIWGFKINPTDAEKRKIGIELAKYMKGRKEPVSRAYISNILAGRPAGAELTKAIGELLFIASGEVSREQIKSKVVQVLATEGIDIPPYTLISINARLCICGKYFIPKAWNSKDHSPECRRKRLKMERESHELPRHT